MEKELTYGDDYHFLPVTSMNNGKHQKIAPDLYYLTVHIVNVSLVSFPDNQSWVLVDTGMTGSADPILTTAKEFGLELSPKAIILTHGHFDHVGSVIELSEHWDCPVYAHANELPHLTGKLAYPPADPASSSGLVAKMSPWFPNDPIDLGDRIQPLPANGTIPVMPGWQWIPTPGHTMGHISLFRESDRSLIAGDAFVTVKQEYIYKMFTQELEISGPPKYFTPDWNEAFQSVKRLEALKPKVAITGHGLPLSGEQLSKGLSLLVDEFDSIAVPENSKFN